MQLQVGMQNKVKAAFSTHSLNKSKIHSTLKYLNCESMA